MLLRSVQFLTSYLVKTEAIGPPSVTLKVKKRQKNGSILTYQSLARQPGLSLAMETQAQGGTVHR